MMNFYVIPQIGLMLRCKVAICTCPSASHRVFEDLGIDHGFVSIPSYGLPCARVIVGVIALFSILAVVVSSLTIVAIVVQCHRASLCAAFFILLLGRRSRGRVT